MQYTTLLTSLNNNIFTITINRPDKLNALNKAVMADLDAVMDEVESNRDIKAVIITGAGQKGFVAGADISEFVGLSPAEGMAMAKKGQEVFFKIENCTKPVVAAVNGFALGGGCELAMACHFRIASENAKFGQPEVNLGLIPGYGGTQRLTHLIGRGRAMQILMTGEMIDAQTAAQWGLVNSVVPQESLLQKATEVLTTVLTKAPVAITHIITSVNAAFGQSSGYETEVGCFGTCFSTEDMKEGTSAFLEKRAPAFTGK